jgi:hypothetical protein
MMYRKETRKTKATTSQRVLENMSNKTAWMIAAWSRWY